MRLCDECFNLFKSAYKMFNLVESFYIFMNYYLKSFDSFIKLQVLLLQQLEHLADECVNPNCNLQSMQVLAMAQFRYDGFDTVMSILICRKVQIEFIHKFKNCVGKRLQHMVSLVSELDRLNFKLFGTLDKVTKCLSICVLMKIQNVICQKFSGHSVSQT